MAIGLSKLPEKLSDVEFFCFCQNYELADNFWLSQSKQPNFDYPQMHNNQKIIFVTSKQIDPLNAKQLSCS